MKSKQLPHTPGHQKKESEKIRILKSARLELEERLSKERKRTVHKIQH